MAHDHGSHGGQDHGVDGDADRRWIAIALALGQTMAARPGVREVHDLHVWEVTSGFPALAAHVLVAPGNDCPGLRRELEGLLRERFGIDHTTLQVEHEHADVALQITPAGPARS